MVGASGPRASVLAPAGAWREPATRGWGGAGSSSALGTTTGVGAPGAPRFRPRFLPALVGSRRRGAGGQRGLVPGVLCWWVSPVLRLGRRFWALRVSFSRCGSFRHGFPLWLISPLGRTTEVGAPRAPRLHPRFCAGVGGRWRGGSGGGRGLFRGWPSFWCTRDRHPSTHSFAVVVMVGGGWQPRSIFLGQGCDRGEFCIACRSSSFACCASSPHETR